MLKRLVLCVAGMTLLAILFLAVYCRVMEGYSPPELKQIAASTQSTADRLQNMEAKMLSIEAKMESMERFFVTQNLQWAIQHCMMSGIRGLDSESEFRFQDIYPNNNHGVIARSNHVVANILGSFMEGRGVWISDTYHLNGNDEKARQDFRDALSRQIHRLTGVKPRIQKETNSEGKEQWKIYRV